jgi:hypothetical protein
LFRLTALSTTTVSLGGSDLAWANVLSLETPSWLAACLLSAEIRKMTTRASSGAARQQTREGAITGPASCRHEATSWLDAVFRRALAA